MNILRNPILLPMIFGAIVCGIYFTLLAYHIIDVHVVTGQHIALIIFFGVLILNILRNYSSN